MKIKLLLSFFIISSLVFGQSTEFKVGKIFKITYPDSYVKTYDLNDVASIQRSNVVQNKYSIVIQDEKASLDFLRVKFSTIEETLEFYCKGLKESIKEGTLKASAPKKITVNNHPAIEEEFEGTITDDETGKDISIYYNYVVVETPEYYYQILSWTPIENKQKYSPEFKSIASSFKEID